MQYLLIAYDGKDEGALDRRLAVRDQHLALGDRMVERGEALFATAILDDDGRMIGSMQVMDFPSLAELNAYLQTEPYVAGNVWQDIRVQPCRVGPSFAH